MKFELILLLLAGALPASAAVSAARGGVALATRNYPAGATSLIPVTVTLTEEPGFTITATLDGAHLPMGTTTVTTTGYHEIHETKINTATNAVTTSLAFQFIIACPGRGTTEMGLPISQPRQLVNDAPSAFAGQVLDVIAPRRYPLNLPVPVAVRLKKGPSAGVAAGDPLFLHGRVESLSYPSRSIQMKRGWGSTILPARQQAGAMGFDGRLNGLADPAPIVYEDETAWVNKGGNLTGAETWADNSRIYLSSTITVKAGATLTVGPGTVIRATSGTELWVEPGGTVLMNGTLLDPVVVAPDSTGAPWGGVWLHQSATATVASFMATGTLFSCWGANQNWYTAAGITPSRTIFSRHRQQQPCFAIGTGAVCRLTDCALMGPIASGEPRGAGFAMKDGSLFLTRTSVQRCITGGEQEGGTVEIESSAIFEITEPGTNADDGAAFDNSDNDGIYLVPGAGHTYHISKTFFGWTKDDGIDSGGSGSGATVCDGCWFENCTHEAFSNSGTGRIPETHHGVHFNNGQGMECGYGDNATGPLSLVNHSLLVGNLCGARYGDNYNTFGGYGGTLTLQNSFLLYNSFRDAFAMEWRPASNWAYQDARIVARNTKFSRAEDLAHQQGGEDTPANSIWNPTLDGAAIAAFMPIPDSNVGVAILHDHSNEPISLYPADGVFPVGLSSFSSKPVVVSWQATGKAARDLPDETTIASGTLTFQPGETVKDVTAPMPSGAAFQIVRLSLGSPVNAEITGQDVWYLESAPLESATLFAKNSAGWEYYANRVPAAAGQKPPPDASGLTWTAVDYAQNSAWKTNNPAPLGWGNLGASAPYLTLGTVLPAAEQGITTYLRKSFNLEDPSRIRSLTLDLLCDDGAVAFINGVAFPPVNVDPGTAVGGVAGIGSDKLATVTKGDGTAETVYDSLEADSPVLSALRAGANLLSLEIHQGSASSGDAVGDASLSVALNPTGAGEFSVFSINGATFLTWDDSYRTLEESMDLNFWTTVPDAPNPFPIKVGEPSRRFYRARR